MADQAAQVLEAHPDHPVGVKQFANRSFSNFQVPTECQATRDRREIPAELSTVRHPDHQALLVLPVLKAHPVCRAETAIQGRRDLLDLRASPESQVPMESKVNLAFLRSKKNALAGSPGQPGPPGPPGQPGSCDHCPPPRTEPGYHQKTKQR